MLATEAGSTTMSPGLPTLVPENDVRATLGWAQLRGLLHVEGPVDGQFVMTC